MVKEVKNPFANDLPPFPGKRKVI